MDNKDFRDAVYKKYEYYKNAKKDSFYNKRQYNAPLTSTKLAFNYVLSFAVICVMVSGVVYATSQYIKYTKEKNIWKKPETYNYQDGKSINENDMKTSITEEEANEIAKKTLQNLKIEPGNITSSSLNKIPFEDTIEWIIKTDNNLDIKLNAKTGKIESFYNNNLYEKTGDLKTKEYAIEKATEMCEEIREGLDLKKNYELSSISSMGGGKWSVDFSVKYNDIFNDYQTIRFIFFPSTQEIFLLKIFDYEFENNPFEIEEEQAINIAKATYGQENIKDVFAKKDIKMMNAMVYMKENPPVEGQYYRTENIVRNIWNIEIVEQNTGFSETYYVDATTGEIIGGSERLTNI